MKKYKTKRKLTPFLIAFLAAALVFLAVGLGTLGSFRAVGDDFELRGPSADGNGDMQSSTVIFRLDSGITETYTDEDGKEQTRTVSLQIDDVYLYVSAIYSEAGVPATVSLRRSSSRDDDFFGSQLTASLENLYTAEPAEETEDGKNAVQTDALYRWIHPFTFSTPWTLSTYPYWELSATASNLRIAEVLFVGHPTGSTSEHSAERYIVSASVYSATPDTGETAEQARAEAEALLDGDLNAQVRAYVNSLSAEETKGTAKYPGEDAIPTDAVSSYDTFTKPEIYSLLTITEMRVGSRYTTDINNRDRNVYHVEGVYNVLGMDLMALGVAIFGMSPFGLRFLPMLFSFGIMVLGFFFVRKLFKSDRAGFVFCVLYALCDLSFSLGHLGTPLTAGLFFLLLSAYLVDSFYRKGMKKAGFKGLAPLLFGGLSAAAAICVNGAMLIPVLAVCGLYVAGMIRQAKANRYYLDKAIAECEAQPGREDGTKDTGKVAKVLTENRYKTLSAGILFPAVLVFGTFLFSLLFILPVYSPLLKFYEGSASAANMFALGWKAFAGGFVGVNELGGMPSAWNIFYIIFKGAGESYAVTAAVINAAAAVCGLIGLAFAVWRLVVICKNFGEGKKELRRIIVPLAGLAVSLVTASFGGGALGFVFLAYIFSFMLAANAADFGMALEEGKGKAAKAVSIAALVLTLVCFALFAIFTFSVPMPAGFMAKFF